MCKSNGVAFEAETIVGQGSSFKKKYPYILEQIIYTRYDYILQRVIVFFMGHFLEKM